MKRILFSILGVFIFSIAYSQDIKSEADAFFKKKEYGEAIKYYEKALKSKSKPEVKRQVAFQLGECHRLTLNYLEARKYYVKAVELGYEEPIIYMHLGDTYLKSSDYTKAGAYYQKYQNLKPSDTKVKQKIESCAYSADAMKKKPIFSVKEEKSINSTSQEFGVGFLPMVATLKSDLKKSKLQYDKQTLLAYSNRLYWAFTTDVLRDRLVFTSNRCEGSTKDVTSNACFSDIFQALYDKKNDQWIELTRLKGEINSKNNDAYFSYCEATKIGYYMQCQDPEGGVKQSKEQICNIYYALYDDIKDTWSDSKILEFHSQQFDMFHPSISEDGKTLYFASNMPGGFGGIDIWKIVKEGEGKWGKPVNLGPSVNTEELEAYPFLMGDSVLYFASTGHTNMGGRDVFRSNINGDGTYGQAENMGYPINSSADEVGFTVHPSNKYGYFASDRNGNDDIYRFTRIRSTWTMTGNVKDDGDIKNLKNIKVICKGADYSLRSTYTNENGDYEFPGLDPDVFYWVFVKKDGLLSEVIQTPPKKEIKIPIPNPDTVLTPRIDTTHIAKTPEVKNPDPPKKDTIRIRTYDPKGENEIKNIYWDFDRADLRTASKSELDKLTSFLTSDLERYIIINSYTDERGTEEYNKELSQRRAQSVVDYMIHKGIPTKRISAVGRGKTNLVKKRASTEEEHQLNRRTTFKIVSKQEFSTYVLSPNVFVEKDVDTSKYVATNFTKDPNISNEVVSGLEFRVQFIATKNVLNPHYYNKLHSAFPSQPLKYSFEEDGFHRHYIGSFRDLKAALKFVKEIKSLGYDGFVVPFNNGKKISIPEAKELLKR